jgi:hypothetical protein
MISEQEIYQRRWLMHGKPSEQHMGDRAWARTTKTAREKSDPELMKLGHRPTRSNLEISKNLETAAEKNKLKIAQILTGIIRTKEQRDFGIIRTKGKRDFSIDTK